MIVLRVPELSRWWQGSRDATATEKGSLGSRGVCLAVRVCSRTEPRNTVSTALSRRGFVIRCDRRAARVVSCGPRGPRVCPTSSAFYHPTRKRSMFLTLSFASDGT